MQTPELSREELNREGDIDAVVDKEEQWSQDIPTDLPVDTSWEDVYPNTKFILTGGE